MPVHNELMLETNVSTEPLAYYACQGPIADPGEHVALFVGLPDKIAELCRVLHDLVLHPFADHLYNVNLTGTRKREVHILRVPEMLTRLLEIDDRPLTVAREPKDRLVGNCRDFAVMLCSMLRHQGIPARMRGGFGAYLHNDDHWICEYWHSGEQRWILVDPQLDEVQRRAYKIEFDPCDVPRDQFIIAGDAWQLYRTGQVDSRKFGFRRWRGKTFICSSVIRDLVALNRVEVRPWDSWWDSRLVEPEQGHTQEELAYIDHIAELTLGGNEVFREMRALYDGDARISTRVEEHLQELGRKKHAQVVTLTEQQRWRISFFQRLPDTTVYESRQVQRVEAPPRRVDSLEPDKIEIRGAQQHNLKNINVSIPRYKLVVLTGVSGSGKSSLAFDTIYAEGQRRYVESLSPFVRQFLEKVEKPKVDFIGGLSPAISIEQRTVSKNPRSTVGTVTEVMHYLRLLYSRIGTPHCLQCGSAIMPHSAWEIAQQLEAWLAEQEYAGHPQETPVHIMAPVVRNLKGSHANVIEQARRDGLAWARIDGVLVELGDEGTLHLAEMQKHTIELVVGSLRGGVWGDDRRDGEALSAGKRSRSHALRDGETAQKEEVREMVKRALRLGDGVLVVDFGNGQEVVLSERRLCPNCGTSFPELTSQHFSPNSPFGMCSDCNGLGTKLEVDPELIVQDPHISIMEGALRWYGNMRKKRQSWYTGQLQSIAEHYGADVEMPWRDLPPRFREALLYGSGDEKIHITHKNEGDEGSWSGESVRVFKGLVYEINRLFRATKSDHTRRWYASFMSQQPCPACGGARLSAEVRSVTLNGKAIHEIGGLTIDRLLAWVDALYATLSDEQLAIADEALKETRDRLQFMLNVGLHYLSLDRSAPSLSGGEGQRIRLASQLGCGLVGVLYVLDEPSIGLHARDQRTLLDTLLQLRDIGNTVLVVEHDAETMRAADWLIDLGPGAGILGGEVVAAGTPQEVAANPSSLTGRYLSGQMAVVAPAGHRRRDSQHGWLSISGARLHNLKHVEARFPLGLLTCVTGVSGSGKSSLVNGTLYPALSHALHHTQEPAGPYERLEGLERLNKIINITQDPIGRTPRSNPATYVGVFDDIRRVFAGTPEARKRGYKADRFSFNVSGGRCESCKGHGQKVIEMHFLSDVWVPCKECQGTRFNQETLAVCYQGKNIAEVLAMDVQEALALFADHPTIARILRTLGDVGLDYVKLGQSATTLSGGEAQRVKLAKELSRVATGRTLYILDEPTTGLHFADIQHLLDVLHRLVDAGNTVIVIEHNLDVIKTADWLIDMGPDGGEAGGTIVAKGPPETVARAEASYTGQFLGRELA